MEQPIGAPLKEAADANRQMTNSTLDFINRVGFDANGNVRNVSFKYEKNESSLDVGDT